MAPETQGFNGIFGPRRNTLLSKWDILFDKDAKEWIAFKPALGLHVYPCYSCRHMFFSKKSFQDHINRRAVILSYKCTGCTNETITFYNRCAFLLHCRKHYTLEQGAINLNNLEVSSLPFGLAGFSRFPDIPYLFDVEEEYVIDNVFMNAQFYAPKYEDRGKDIITLSPSHLVINRTDSNGEIQALSLKQIARNIPKCQFISLQTLRELRIQLSASDEDVDVKPEPEEPEELRQEEAHQEPQESFENGFNSSQGMVLPVITKIETVEEPSTDYPVVKCSECMVPQGDSLGLHFLGFNRPTNENFRCPNCKLICPTQCAFTAHVRMHQDLPPYICPDCGGDFDGTKLLKDHMDSVCYHLSKSARFRCPGRRCGKLFASETTYAQHFQMTHIKSVYKCGTCHQVFGQLDEAEAHSEAHETLRHVIKLHCCMVCSMEDLFNPVEFKKHIEDHLKDLSRCIYIYMCKYCKCYFRSLATMSVHIKKCAIERNGVPKRSRPGTSKPFMTSKYVSGSCKNCKNKLIFLKSHPIDLCNKCVQLKNELKRLTASNRCVCILCKKQITVDQRRQHQKECKYGKPQVLVKKLNTEQISNFLNQSSQSFSSSSSDLDMSIGSRKHRSDSSDDVRRKKRHRTSKPKKQPEIEPDLIADEPIPFDGTYSCRLCSFKDSERSIFHEHVKSHRHISTAYQCMECGECFVVKPSLVKHLLHYHNIYNFEQYCQENNCFDEGAVKELAKVVKAPYLAKTVKENQCKICMEEFGGKVELDKHFRIHGMAFLMKNSI